MERNKEQKK